MNGQVTVAQHIRGERVGQTVQRVWTFTPLCDAGPCQSVELARRRSSGVDRLVLQLAAADYYVGNGSFYAPVRCSRRLRRKGELVPFRITVTITNAVPSGATTVANEVHATYTNPYRINRTRCVALPRHDAAVYDGQAFGPG
jgi:hypothetical protein